MHAAWTARTPAIVLLVVAVEDAGAAPPPHTARRDIHVLAVPGLVGPDGGTDFSHQPPRGLFWHDAALLVSLIV